MTIDTKHLRRDGNHQTSSLVIGCNTGQSGINSASDGLLDPAP